VELRMMELASDREKQDRRIEHAENRIDNLLAILANE